jgi:pilus assembly protein Flp/PilA
MFESLKQLFRRIRDEVDGAVFVEYVLLVTLVGLGAIVGLSTVRDALINELTDLANAITNLNI